MSTKVCQLMQFHSTEYILKNYCIVHETNELHCGELSLHTAVKR